MNLLLVHSRCSLPLLLALVVLAVISAAPLALAAESQGPLVLTLEEALGLAAKQNRDIQKAIEYRAWVQGKYVEERAAALPQVTIAGGGTRVSDESMKDIYSGIAQAAQQGQGMSSLFSDLFPTQQDVATGEVGLSQALFTWGQLGAAIRAAKVGLAIAEDQLRLYRQAAARDVSAAFYDVLLAKELAALAVQNLEQKERLADEARRKNEAGTATDYDVLSGQVAVQNARPEVIRTQNLVRTAIERLSFLLALKDTEMDVQGTLTSPIAPYPDYEDALAQAFQHRPELAEVDHRRKVATELVKIANAGDKPRLDFKGAYGWKEVRLERSDSDGQTWQAGLYLSFPIFDGLRARGKVTQAKSDVATIGIEEAKLNDSMGLQVQNAVDAVREAGEIVKALSGTVGQAERLLFMAEKGYEFGVKTNLDVKDAQLNLIQAKGSLARACRDYLVSNVNLEWVKGTIELPAE